MRRCCPSNLFRSWCKPGPFVPKNAVVPAGESDPALRQNRNWWGIMQVQRGELAVAVRDAHVRDGLSQTFLIFEAAGKPDHLVAGALVDPAIMGVNTIGDFRWGSPDVPISINEHCEGRLVNCHNWDEVYSYHPEGSIIAFADASVRMLLSDTDPETFVSLFTMAGSDVPQFP